MSESEVGRLQEQAHAEIVTLRETLGLLHRAADSVRVDIDVDEVLPDLPEPPPSLIARDMPLVEHIRALRERKDYGRASA